MMNKFSINLFAAILTHFNTDQVPTTDHNRQMKLVSAFIIVMISTGSLYAQETLDLNKNKDCELFPEKGKFDTEERLKKIKEIGGQSVTVYLVKGKNNRIKSKYTGKVELRSIDNEELSLDTRTKVLVVTVNQGNGKMISYLPLTYDKNFRIYLKDCLEQ